MIDYLAIARIAASRYACYLSAADRDDMQGYILLQLAKLVAKPDAITAGGYLAVFARRRAVDWFRENTRWIGVSLRDPSTMRKIKAKPVPDSDFENIIAVCVPREQKILRMQYLEGRTHAEIARLLRLSPARIVQLVARAYKRIERARYAHNGGSAGTHQPRALAARD